MISVTTARNSTIFSRSTGSVVSVMGSTSSTSTQSTPLSPLDPAPMRARLTPAIRAVTPWSRLTSWTVTIVPTGE